MITIEGWCLGKGVDSDGTEYQVYVKSLLDNTLYTLTTGKVLRKDVTGSHSKDGNDYDESGFIAMGDLDLLDLENDAYQVYVSAERAGESRAVYTNCTFDVRLLRKKQSAGT